MFVVRVDNGAADHAIDDDSTINDSARDCNNGGGDEYGGAGNRPNLHNCKKRDSGDDYPKSDGNYISYSDHISHSDDHVHNDFKREFVV